MRKDDEREDRGVRPDHITVELPSDFMVPARFARSETSRELVLALLRDAKAEAD
ncbi:MAG: hypothetical protein KF773_36375 [Deltaproteobacteria bacterium]|nr:hypothetical protein [Deltaproteobacteria bacterium]MCW5808202.1 hypothetical protein [Deltaproteobacteria bacterium]